jgi:hypothetical protein
MGKSGFEPRQSSSKVHILYINHVVAIFLSFNGVGEEKTW